MKKILLSTLITTAFLSGCSMHSLNNDGTPKYNDKDQAKLEQINQQFQNTGVPAYVDMFPTTSKGIANSDKSLNSQAVLNNFNKNWNTYYYAQHELVSGIINVNKNYYKDYMDKAKIAIREQDLDKNIPKPYIQNICNQDATKTKDEKGAYAQCVFFNEMLNTDRAITVATFNGANPTEIQNIIDHGKYAASDSYLSLIQNAYKEKRWYQPIIR